MLWQQLEKIKVGWVIWDCKSQENTQRAMLENTVQVLTARGIKEDRSRSATSVVISFNGDLNDKF